MAYKNDNLWQINVGNFIVETLSMYQIVKKIIFNFFITDASEICVKLKKSSDKKVIESNSYYFVFFMNLKSN